MDYPDDDDEEYADDEFDEEDDEDYDDDEMEQGIILQPGANRATSVPAGLANMVLNQAAVGGSMAAMAAMQQAAANVRKRPSQPVSICLYEHSRPCMGMGVG